jgi:class 3 adenylate cyclase
MEELKEGAEAQAGDPPLPGRLGRSVPERPRSLVGRFVPLQVERLLEAGRPRARRRCSDIAVMFVDLESCTRRCEALSGAAMNRLLETYFSRYFEIVRQTGGEVTEFLGDGVLAIFEKPSLEENVFSAVAASLKIRRATRELNLREARRHDPVIVNIGLNAGAASVGITRFAGSWGERWVYGAAGPVTNIAARLCSLAAGGQILTPRAVAGRLAGSCTCRDIGPRVLKNVPKPVRVFEILSLKAGGHHATPGARRAAEKRTEWRRR